jgi:cobalt-zinc-cadmium efflux system protein
MAHTHDHDHDHAGHAHTDHGHSGHSHAPTVTRDNERVVLLGLILTAGFMLVEIVGGLLSGSLALIADAGHMLTDAVALGLAWLGFRLGRQASDARRTFGHARFEVLAGFVNALTLLLLVAWIAYEAVQRLLAPAPVLAGPMMIVALLGLGVNILVLVVLRQGDRDHINIRGAMLHVVGDLLGSVAAIAAAITIHFTGWTPIDPILSVLLSAIILRSGWLLLRSAIDILMEGAPAGIDIADMGRDIVARVPGLADVEHVHVWSITSGTVAATLEARVDDGADSRQIVSQIKQLLAERYGIGHTTVEVCWADSAQCSLAGAAGGHQH